VESWGGTLRCTERDHRLAWSVIPLTIADARQTTQTDRLARLAPCNGVSYLSV